MSKLLSLFTLNMLIIATLFSQNEYSVDNIPENLKKNAGSVIRQYDAELKITSPSQAQLKKKYVITILHESHKKRLSFMNSMTIFQRSQILKLPFSIKQVKKFLMFPDQISKTCLHLPTMPFLLKYVKRTISRYITCTPIPLNTRIQ